MQTSHPPAVQTSYFTTTNYYPTHNNGPHQRTHRPQYTGYVRPGAHQHQQHSGKTKTITDGQIYAKCGQKSEYLPIDIAN